MKKKRMHFELLKRNVYFLEELDKVKGKIGIKYFIVRKNIKKYLVTQYIDGYPELKAEIEGFQQENPDFIRDNSSYIRAGQILFSDFEDIWDCFCYRWCIYPDWSGEMDDLAGSLYPLVEVFYEDGLIHIVLDNWAVGSDVLKDWPRVEKIQKKMGKVKGKGNFERDLRWHGLSSNGLGIKEIARMEKKSFIVNKMVLKKLRKGLSEDDLKGRSLSDIELHKEIMNGFLSDKYKEEYVADCRNYVTPAAGLTNLEDVIRHALERMDNQVYSIKPRRIRSSKLAKLLEI